LATFNASLTRSSAGDLIDDLSSGDDAQARAVAEIIQRVAPDVLLINEFDYDEDGEAASLFRQLYLEQGLHETVEPISFPYFFSAPVNTGIPSGHDLDNRGGIGGPGDALGFGAFPGQYGMLVLSKHPIRTDGIRTFQSFLWRDMPGALLPDGPATAAPTDWYDPDELDVLRLSAKSHWDLPIAFEGGEIRVLVSHPTPPVFDDPPDYPAGVDFNGRRNHDEIRFWADYVAGGDRASYIVDDSGRSGGIAAGAAFVIMGDLNADPDDGDSYERSIGLLLDHPRVNDTRPASAGAIESAHLEGGADDDHIGDPRLDTSDFRDGPGNLRVDYVLPSTGLDIDGAGVFWPMRSEDTFRLVGDSGTTPAPSSDHRAVWVDLSF
jgi:hypothetical protein